MIKNIVVIEDFCTEISALSACPAIEGIIEDKGIYMIFVRA